MSALFDITHDAGSIDVCNPVDWDAWRELIGPLPYLWFLNLPQLNGRWTNLAARVSPVVQTATLPAATVFKGAQGRPGGFASRDTSSGSVSGSAALPGTWPLISSSIWINHASNNIRTLLQNWNIGTTASNLAWSTYSSGSFNRSFSCSAGVLALSSHEPTNSWLHWSVAYDGRQMRWLENNKLLKSSAATGNALTSVNANKLLLPQSFDGAWDDLIIWQAGLSIEQQGAHYRISSSGYRDVLRRTPGRSYFWVGAAGGGGSFQPAWAATQRSSILGGGLR